MLYTLTVTAIRNHPYKHPHRWSWLALALLPMPCWRLSNLILSYLSTCTDTYLTSCRKWPGSALLTILYKKLGNPKPRGSGSLACAMMRTNVLQQRPYLSTCTNTRTGGHDRLWLFCLRNAACAFGQRNGPWRVPSTSEVLGPWCKSRIWGTAFALFSSSGARQNSKCGDTSVFLCYDAKSRVWGTAFVFAPPQLYGSGISCTDLSAGKLWPLTFYWTGPKPAGHH